MRGGDRLPWTGDNYQPLTSLDWQAHVYGTASQALREVFADLHVPLHVFAWDAKAQAAGLARDAVYVVRPDGYVGLADAELDVARLRRYVHEHGVSMQATDPSRRSRP